MTPGWKDAKNILCLRLDYLGDVLMCTPSMRAARRLAGPPPDAARIAWRRGGCALRCATRRGHCLRSALDETRRGAGRRCRDVYGPAAARRRLRCRRHLYRLQPERADLAWARERLARLGIGSGTRWVLMHPGTTASRRYPPAHWAGALRLLAESGMQAVLTGSAEEGPLVDQVRAGAAVAACSHSLAGQLTLGQLGALISLAPVMVMVSNNTGPAHIAAALGTPLVDLYALTNPQHTPWQSPNRMLFHDVPCRNCYKSAGPQGHHARLAGVQPARVAEAVDSLLRQAGPAGRGLLEKQID